MVYLCVCTGVFMYVGILGFCAHVCTHVNTSIYMLAFVLYVYGPALEYIYVCVSVHLSRGH